MKRIPSLDGFRAISIILVLISHCAFLPSFPRAIVEVASQGKVGVTVFFVISGFLITSLLLIEDSKNNKVNLKAFYIRRSFRILPVFFLYVVFILVWRNFENLGITGNNILHVFTFTVNFDEHKNWFLGHIWTLSVEEQFYLMWPVIFILFRKRLKTVLVLMLVYSCICRVIDYKFPMYSNIALAPFFIYADAILIGVLGSVLHFENPEMLKNKAFSTYWLQLLALGIFVFFVYCAGYGKLPFISLPIGHTLVSAAALFLIMCYIAPKKNLFYKLLNSRVMIHIGVLSYSIYLWQEFFFVGEPKFSFLRILPLNIVFIYIVALASYYFWETPFLKLRKYVLK